MHATQQSPKGFLSRLDSLKALLPGFRAPTGNRAINLRDFQTELLRHQRAARLSGLEQAKEVMRRRRHRLRVRHEIPGHCKIVDTVTDANRSRLYFELSNGMIVRADRASDRQEFNPKTGRFKKGRRRQPLLRPLRDLIAVEVAMNASRRAA